MKSRTAITVFEHESLKTDSGEKRITQLQHEALQKFYGEKGVPYYSLIHHGVKFNEYVGVIQIGNQVIEVLPKSDKSRNELMWRNVLIGMLRASGMFNIKAPTSSDLRLRPNSILDLYIELFANELEYLLHHGLSRKYRSKEGNISAFKGRVIFHKHIQHNLIHQERVYTNYTIFDVHHPLHQILFKTLKLISRLNTSSSLQSRIGSLMLDFPEMPDIRVNEGTFERIILNRNTQHYQKSLDIARLLLLNYHPDVSRGGNHVLALMFDMNMLWEKFVFASLRKELTTTYPGTTVTPQTRKYFWKPDIGYRTTVIPDLMIKIPDGRTFIVDTKWKNLTGVQPSPDDLRQLYVYHEYFTANKVAIIYPGKSGNTLRGNYLSPNKNEVWDKECSLIPVGVEENIRNWQANIGRLVLGWAGGE